MFWRKPREIPVLADSPLWPPFGMGEDGEKWAFLAEHPWVGPAGRSHPAARPGGNWVICADMVAEEALFDKLAWAEKWQGSTDDPKARMELGRGNELFALSGPVGAFSHLGRPLQPAEVAGLRFYGRPLVLMEAGTMVTFRQWSGGTDEQWGEFRENAKFELADGRTFTLPTWCHLVEDLYGLTLSWREVACAALIVPADHRLATDRAAAEELSSSLVTQIRGDLPGADTLEAGSWDPARWAI
jgi:hypothetical protein